MYYTESFVDGLENSPELAIPQDRFLETSAKNAAAMLDENMLAYKCFGVYWWAVKDALRQYVDNGAWYCGKADDPHIKSQNWHGSLRRTVLAGMYYMSEESGDFMDFSDIHSWYDNDEGERGFEHECRLFDSNAGL